MEVVEPLVSVVIPTRNRPDLVVRAIRSVLTQTFTAIEIIVVLDGPDGLTAERLQGIGDRRVHITSLPGPQGGAAARNAGVAAAKGKWIAFLDDDDEWLPTKLDIQLRTAQQSAFQDPVISCRLIKRSDADDIVLPRRFPTSGEPMSDYLFRRTRLFGGEGLVQTSTILTTRV
ncbi:MAG: glycosyltransferase family 2 protein, partial [Nitrospirales bacterium]|nr:glycosyltransferase family 2 protein [Nitrospirales bacterium]